MSKKILAFSLLSLCVLLRWCGTQNNTVDENQCVDDSCAVQNNDVAKERANENVTSEIEDDIVGLDENAGEIPVAEKLSWEPIVVEWWERDF